jgi:hypothetical protein
MSADEKPRVPMPIEEILRLNLRKRIRPKQKPTLVTERDEASAKAKIVGSATVHLSPSDPNWRGSDSQYVRILDRWDDDGPGIEWSYNPLDVLNKGPRFHG